MRPLPLRRLPPPAELLLGAVLGRAQDRLRAALQAREVLPKLRVQGKGHQEELKY